MERLDHQYGRVIGAMAYVALLLVLLMMVVICADVFVRNVPLGPIRSVTGANEISEYTLYLLTMLIAPWLLRQGQHIRVDIVLRVIPARLAWLSEWLVDLMALAACLIMAWYGLKATLASQAIGSMIIKSVVMPEWWLLAPLPIAFVLLAIEVLFRMRRLAIGPVGPRDDAVSSA
jgi:TRAP-type transport system small permease protein